MSELLREEEVSLLLERISSAKTRLDLAYQEHASNHVTMAMRHLRSLEFNLMLRPSGQDSYRSQHCENAQFFYQRGVKGYCILSSTGGYIEGVSHFEPRFNNPLQTIPRKKRLKGNYIFLGDGHHSNMWHTCIVVLRNLAQINRNNSSERQWLFRRNPKILTYSTAWEWSRFLLSLLDLRVAPIDPYTLYTVENLLVPCETDLRTDSHHESFDRISADYSQSNSAITRYSSLRQVRLTVRARIEDFPTPKSHLYNKIYVSRRRAGRPLLNELELERRLMANGFTIVFLEDYEPSRQLEIFASAKVIVSPHGAGLCNMIACADECIIVEIYNPSMNRRTYLAMANEVELGNFMRFPSSPAEGKSHVISIEHFMTFLDSLSLPA
ncbi:DUF563 domain-containing protein [Cyanobium sp. CH-040]|uniref:glycosyltransferase family 61 protein n=1 Tax=Cyanobium sp. CH-040 TaxID=2823708 RepID=UPI0020CDB4E6|nr:glycosyltransferase 61 family protein [Cyanobium sp. CH-040]MCP9926725.1 glycosyltransferase family 61 protein [Cyanobium sp. CH-040]